jgi:hypothetical protein
VAVQRLSERERVGMIAPGWREHHYDRRRNVLATGGAFMGERKGQEPHVLPGGPGRDETVESAIDEAARRLRAPWAASVAGLLFSVLFTSALVLLRNQPMLTASDEELVQLFAEGKDTPALVGGLYLVPFAGIMFLWFIAVIRDQIGEREDRFFATVFFGSGVLFVACLFVAAAASSFPLVGVRYLGQEPPTAQVVALARALSYTLLFAFATRAAAVFLIATATLGLKSRVFPRWFAVTGYLLGAALFVVVTFWDWVVLVLPAWVFVVSLFILRQERSRRRTG